MNIVTVASGALVFVSAVLDEIPLLNWVLGDPIGLVAVIAATISLLVMWKLIDTTKIFIPRVLAGFQVTMILLAISYAHFPTFVIMKHIKLSLMDSGAPDETMRALGLALLMGSAFILPALFYLYYSFQKKDVKNY